MSVTIPKVDICTLSEFKEDDIMVSRFAEYLEVHHNLIFPHRHSFYHLVYFTVGSGTHTIDFAQFTVRPQQIYFMTPGQVHSWSFEGKVDGYLVNFSPEFFHSFLLRPEYLDSFYFLNGVTEDSVLNLSDFVADKLTRTFEELIETSAAVAAFREDLIRVQLLEIFILIAQSGSRDKIEKVSAPSNMVIKNFQRLVENNFLKMKLPGEYARKLSVTPNHLNALSKIHLGMQAGEVIRLRTILEAKRLLVSIDLTVSEIAYKLNFSDNSYFTKFFRKYTGLTPESFRKKALIERQ